MEICYLPIIRHAFLINVSLVYQLSSSFLCSVLFFIYLFLIFYFFFFNSVLHPFQDYFSSYEMGQSVGG